MTGLSCCLRNLKVSISSAEVVPVERTVVGQAELLEEHGRPQQALGGFFGAAHDVDARSCRRSVPAAARRCRAGACTCSLVTILCRYLAIAPTLRSMDHSLSLSTTIRRLVCSAMLFSASKEMPLVKAASPASATMCSLPPARSRATAMPKRGGERGAGVACAVGVVLAFGAQHEAVQAAGLADGLEAVAASGKQLVDIGLMADVEDEAVGRRVEDVVHGEGQFDDAEIWAQGDRRSSTG